MKRKKIVRENTRLNKFKKSKTNEKKGNKLKKMKTFIEKIQN